MSLADRLAAAREAQYQDGTPATLDLPEDGQGLPETDHSTPTPVSPVEAAQNAAEAVRGSLVGCENRGQRQGNRDRRGRIHRTDRNGCHHHRRDTRRGSSPLWSTQMSTLKISDPCSDIIEDFIAGGVPDNPGGESGGNADVFDVSTVREAADSSPLRPQSAVRASIRLAVCSSRNSGGTRSGDSGGNAIVLDVSNVRAGAGVSGT